MTRAELAPRQSAIDEEIRAVLAQAEPVLQPFYGMMLYHLGLDVSEQVGSGKRLRPLILVLLYESLAADLRPALPAAAAIELLHNFTLIHDDIEDQDPTRRHRPTVWSVWGVPQAINAGDGMYAASRLAVHRLTSRGIAADRVLEFARLLDAACVQVCEGQFLDISFESRTDVTAERHRGMVAKKTGALFSAAAEGAAVLGGAQAEVREALVRFGADFGQAFQAHDDLLGIWATTERTGKIEMNDITKRKKTLPVVLAFERRSKSCTRPRRPSRRRRSTACATSSTTCASATSSSARSASTASARCTSSAPSATAPRARMRCASSSGSSVPPRARRARPRRPPNMRRQ